MASRPTQLNTGNTRPVNSHAIIKADNPDVEREQLNRTLKALRDEIVALASRVDAVDTVLNSASNGSNYDLVVDGTNFTLTATSPASDYLDIVAGGIGESELATTGVTAATYGSATAVPAIVVTATGRVTSASNTSISIPHTQVSDFDEAAQDAVGGILTNSADISLTYNDGVPSVAPALLTTAVTAGSYGTASNVGTFTVDTKGRLTAASNTAIAITASQVTDFSSALTTYNVWRLAPTATQVGNYTAAVGELVLCNANSGSFDVTLPNPTLYANQLVGVKNFVPSTNSVTILGTLENGITSTTLNNDYQCIIFQSNGTVWVAIAAFAVNGL